MLTHQPESHRDSVEPAAGSHHARLTVLLHKRKTRPLGALFCIGGSCRMAFGPVGLALRVMLTHQPESNAIQS
ncbi:hypothetical protein HA47_03565, partial [Pantoea stewartii subsp. indologenes]